MPKPFNTSVSAHRRNLIVLWPHVHLIHHLPGRLRIQVRNGVSITRDLRRQAAAGEKALQQLLPGVRSIRFNALAGSLVLEYDTKQMPFAMVDDFFRAANPDQAVNLLDRLISYHPQ